MPPKDWDILEFSTMALHKSSRFMLFILILQDLSTLLLSFLISSGAALQHPPTIIDFHNPRPLALSTIPDRVSSQESYETSAQSYA